MKPASLVDRLALLQQVLGGLLILAFSGSAIWISSKTLERQEASYLDNTTIRMTRSLQQEWIEYHDLRRAAMSAVEEGAPPAVRVDILDDRGDTLATSGGVATPAGELRVRRSRGIPGAWIVASVSMRPRRDAVRVLSTVLLVTALPMLIGISLLGRGLARRALYPLARMTAQAARTGESRSGEAVEPLGYPSDPSEITALATSFDRLLARLDEVIRAERHFTEDAAHELRTPLTALSGEIEHALADPVLGVRQRESLQRASSQVLAMIELVEALLFLRQADDLNRDPHAEFAPVNMADIARDTVAALGARQPERAPDMTVEAVDEALVVGHAVLLDSAMRNLVSNALKFTDRGQPIRVAVRSRGEVCAVRVEDGGIGIAPRDRENIFDAFYRGSEARATHPGFGLGLAILRRVVRAHGGDVLVSSSPLGGAQFEMRLPNWAPRG